MSNLLFSSVFIIIIIIIIIITPYKVFAPALVDSLSRESERHQISKAPQDFSWYSGRS